MKATAPYARKLTVLFAWVFPFRPAALLPSLCSWKLPLLLLAMALSMQELAGQTSFSITYNLAGDGNNVTAFEYNGPAIDGIDPDNLVKVGITSSSSNNNFRGNNWPLGATNESDEFTGTYDPGKYIGFAIDAEPGYSFTITSIILE